MAKLVLALLIGIVGATVIHIAVIFTVPNVADNNAWSRLSRLGGLYDVVRIESLRNVAPGDAALAEGSGTRDFAFVDPAFITASCRFSLENGPVRLVAGGRTDFWSASIYSRKGDNVYSINDRSAVDGRFDLLVGTAEQLVEAKANAAEPGESVIPVEVELAEGYLTVRALVDAESARPDVDAFIRSVTCTGPPLSSALRTGGRDG